MVDVYEIQYTNMATHFYIVINNLKKEKMKTKNVMKKMQIINIELVSYT